MAGIVSGQPQSDYGFFPQTFVLGQLWRASTSDEFVDYVCGSQTIYPGTLCEVTTSNGVDSVRPAQSPTGAALAPLAGVALYKDPRAPALGFAFPGGGGVFQPGDRVPLLRKGRVYASWTGASSGQASLIGVNYAHSSSTSTTGLGYQGAFTVGATSAATGSEVSPATGVRLLKAIGSTTACLVELNLPGALSISGP